MQILPQTAAFLAHRRVRPDVQDADLATPQVNIAYGSYYLRYLLNEYTGRTPGAWRSPPTTEARPTSTTGWPVPGPEAPSASIDRRHPVPRDPCLRAKGAARPSADYRQHLRRVSSGTAEAQRPFRVRLRGELGSENMPKPPFELDSAFQPHRRPAGGGRVAGRGDRGRRALPDPAGSHRDRQDDDHGRHDRGRAAPALIIAHNKTLAAQLCNEFRTYFPSQLGRVLRLLLRLLPARGLRPQQGPVHREGLGDQPGDRPPAPQPPRPVCSPAATS